MEISSNLVAFSKNTNFTCWRFVGHVKFGTTCCVLCVLEGIEAPSSILSLASGLSAFLWVGFLFFLRMNVMISTRKTKMTKAPKHATRIYKVSFDIALELVASPETRGYIFLRYVFKVIYKGVLTTLWVQLSKLLDSFWQWVLVIIFLYWTFFNFFKQCWPYIVYLLDFFFQFQTILLSYKKCDTEKRT